jgi:hypothetical protein
MSLPGLNGTPPPSRAAVQFEPSLFGKSANMEALARFSNEATAGAQLQL